MTILNDLDNKLTQIGNSAAQKAQEVIGNTGLSNTTHGEEQKIEQCYAQIGRQFAQQLSASVVLAEYEALYTKILSLEKEIADLEASPQPMPQGAGGDICENCGAQLHEGQEFCINCGTKRQKRSDFDNMEIVEKTELITPAPTQCGVSTMAEQRTCPVCGTEIESGQRFCISCGNQLN